MSGLLIACVILAVAALLAMKVAPPYMEFLQIKSGKPLTDLSVLYVYYYGRKLAGREKEHTGLLCHHATAAVMAYGVCMDKLWPYTDEPFQDESLYDELEGIAPRPSSLREEWTARLTGILERAELSAPEVPFAMAYGRRGEHSEHLGYILAEMQVLARKHPGATW